MLSGSEEWERSEGRGQEITARDWGHVDREGSERRRRKG